MRKKALAVMTTLILAFALTGCVTQVTKESKPSTSASDISASSSNASSSSSTTWTQAPSAADAAKGAGISGFNVPDRTVIADFVFTHPTFGYAEHVAQATYEVPNAAKLIVRKAEGSHSASVTDRDKSEFSESWKNTYEGFEVTSYGPKQGTAVICLWNDGTKEYGVTIEGQNGKDVTMDAEDIDDIVKAVKVAETSQNTQTTQSSQSSKAASSASGPGFDLYSFVKTNNLGTFSRYYYVQGANGTGYWAIVTRGANGGEITTYTDANGKIVKDVEVGSKPDYDGADFDVQALVQANGLGQFKRYYWIQGENGHNYWGIVTIGADGAEHTTYTDERGNIVQGGVEVGSAVDAGSEASFDVNAVVQANGLGQFEHYYWVQGSDGKGYWAIVTRGSDGAEYTTYVDEQGNIIQGGI